jgi:hypothetical protein
MEAFVRVFAQKVATEIYLMQTFFIDQQGYVRK